MKDYIIVNLVGPTKNKVTLFLETSDYFSITEKVIKAGFADYKILNNWKIVKAKIVK